MSEDRDQQAVVSGPAVRIEHPVGDEQRHFVLAGRQTQRVPVPSRVELVPNPIRRRQPRANVEPSQPHRMVVVPQRRRLGGSGEAVVMALPRADGRGGIAILAGTVRSPMEVDHHRRTGLVLGFDAMQGEIDELRDYVFPKLIGEVRDRVLALVHLQHRAEVTDSVEAPTPYPG